MRSNSCSEIVWCDRKRYCGFPLSFVVYEISEDRLFLTSGFWNRQQNQIQLHYIQDLVVTCSLSQRFCGVGTVTVTTIDDRIIELVNIRNPYDVKELLYVNMEEQKKHKRFRFGEYLLDRHRGFPYDR